MLQRKLKKQRKGERRNKMASEHKACKQCKTIYEGSKCPKCGSEEYSDASKGKVIVLDSEKSEIARNLKLKDKGTFAIKL